MNTSENNIQGYKRKYFILRKIRRSPRRIFIIIKYILSFFNIQKEKYLNIENYRNKYAGKTLFIAGAGPSLASYPDNFFDDKISMALHLAFLKFPNTTFASFTEADRALWLMKNDTRFLNSQIISSSPLFPLVRPFKIFKNQLKVPPIVLPYNPIQLKLNNVRKMIDAALFGKKIKYKTNATCLHNGIWSGLILGFNKIYLIGCDHKPDNNNNHYFNTGDKKTEKRQNANDRGWTDKFFNHLCLRQEAFLERIINECKVKKICIKRISNYSEFSESKFPY